jgi:nucleoside-specific outer membrane channel protein Tsx
MTDLNSDIFQILTNVAFSMGGICSWYIYSAHNFEAAAKTCTEMFVLSILAPVCSVHTGTCLQSSLNVFIPVTFNRYKNGCTHLLRSEQQVVQYYRQKLSHVRYFNTAITTKNKLGRHCTQKWTSYMHLTSGEFWFNYASEAAASVV